MRNICNIQKEELFHCHKYPTHKHDVSEATCFPVRWSWSLNNKKIPKKKYDANRSRTGLSNLWHACPKWQESFTAVPIFFVVIFPDQYLYTVQNMCIYTHTHIWLRTDYMTYRCYQIILQWNIWIQVRAVPSVDRIFIVGAPVWRWLGQNVTLDRTFYSLLLKQEAAAAATVTATFCSYCVPRRGLYYK